MIAIIPLLEWLMLMCEKSGVQALETNLTALQAFLHLINNIYASSYVAEKGSYTL